MAFMFGVFLVAHLPPGAQVSVFPVERDVAPGSKTYLKVEISVPQGWVIYAFGQPSDVSLPSGIWVKSGPGRNTGAPIEPNALERYERLFQSKRVRYFQNQVTIVQALEIHPETEPGTKSIDGLITFFLGDDRSGTLHMASRIPFRTQIHVIAPKDAASEVVKSPLEPAAFTADEKNGPIIQTSMTLPVPVIEPPAPPPKPPWELFAVLGGIVGGVTLLHGPRGLFLGGWIGRRLARWPRASVALLMIAAPTMAWGAGESQALGHFRFVPWLSIGVVSFLTHVFVGTLPNKNPGTLKSMFRGLMGMSLAMAVVVVMDGAPWALAAGVFAVLSVRLAFSSPQAAVGSELAVFDFEAELNETRQRHQRPASAA
jgi:hypothetical protein